MRLRVTSLLTLATSILLLGGQAYAQEEPGAPASGTTETAAPAATGEAAAAATGESGMAAATVEKEAERKSPWRGSSFAWKHSMSAGTLDQSLLPKYDPMYMQSFILGPRYHIRDDISLGLGLSFWVEITDGNAVDYPQQWITDNLKLDVTYEPAWAKIPVLDIEVNGALILSFPTATTAAAESLVFAISPTLNFSRSFKLLSGKWLNSLSLGYGFSITKNFNEEANRQIKDPDSVCNPTISDPTIITSRDKSIDNSCRYMSARNVSWGMDHAFSLSLGVWDKLKLGIMFGITNLFYYANNDLSMAGAEGSEGLVNLESYSSHGTDYEGQLAMSIGLSYPVLKWLNVSFSASSGHPQIALDSTYRSPFLDPQYVRLNLGFTIPVDQLVFQVQDWLN